MTGSAEFDPRELMERQAREWLIRLDADEPLTTAQQRALEEWVNRKPAHRDTLVRLAKHWKQANRLTELGPLLTLASGRTPSHSGRPKPRVRLTTAAGLAAIFIVAWFAYWNLLHVNRTYGTAIGEQRTVKLPDGSSIDLNTDSLVRVDYRPQWRTVRLARGEALFSVASDPTRPFQVYAAGEVVRAVGTAFAVHVEAETVNVTVTSGAVEVAQADRSKPPQAVGDEVARAPTTGGLGQLKAGQMTTIRASAERLEVRELSSTELERQLAWRDGFLAFSGQSLADVVGQINRYSRMRLEIADPSVSTITIGGRFRVGDLDGVLGVLRDNFGVEASRVDEHTIRLQRAAALP